MKKYTKLVAFILLLVFSQKTCLSLWMHDWFHIQSKNERVQLDGNKAHVTAASCQCLDEFTTPFEEVAGMAAITAPAIYLSEPVAVYKFYYFSRICSSSLKAPPVTA